MTTTRRALGLFLAIGWAAVHGSAGDLSAQRLSLRPQIGVYIPTEDLTTLALGGTVSKLEVGPSFGAALALRFGSHFGIEATGAYVPTTFSQGTGGTFAKQDAKLFLGDALAVIYLLPPSSILQVHLGAGVGVVSRGGVAFTSQSKSSDVSGVAGAGVGIRLAGITLMAGADLFRYTASYTGTTATASELKQLDVQLKLGLGFGLGGR